MSRQSCTGIYNPAVSRPSGCHPLCKRRSLCRTRLPQSLILCEFGRSFHINHPLYTGFFRLPVGDVGNWGLPASLRSLFSKTPELHSQDLENWPSPQVNAPQSLRKDFHFSCLNYGCYLLFLYLSTLFVTTRRTSQTYIQTFGSGVPRAKTS